MAKSIKLHPNEILLREGDNSSSMYLVLSGQLIVTKKRGNDDIVLGHIYAKELVGEISFLDKEPRSATVKAVSECELMEVPQDTFEKIFNDQPRWLEILYLTLAERLRKADARIKI